MDRYGAGSRNGVDIYLPSPSGTAAPVALFCHGGVWAHGERWHYAPMATRLAQAGVLTMVMSYSLHPKASAAVQTTEVDEALSWSLLNAAKFGGDPAAVRRAHRPPQCATTPCTAPRVEGECVRAGLAGWTLGGSPPLRHGAAASSSGSLAQEASRRGRRSAACAR